VASVRRWVRSAAAVAADPYAWRMRIIAGEFRSRKLISPPEGTPARPMPDRVKEAVFSILRGHFEGAAVVDAFAGSGAVGLEAVSRGARRCVLIERDRRVADVLRANVELLGAGDRCEVVLGDALGSAAVARCPRPVDIVFFDPPYDLVSTGPGWARVRDQLARFAALLADDGFAVLRTPWPFKIRVEDESGGDDAGRGEAAEGGGEGRRRARKKRRAREERGWDWERELAGDSGPARRRGSVPDGAGAGETGGEADGDDEGGDDGAPGSGPGAAGEGEVRARWYLGDLAVAGTVGPETHVYGHTAVHLYMREKEGTEAQRQRGKETRRHGGTGA